MEISKEAREIFDAIYQKGYEAGLRDAKRAEEVDCECESSS